MIEFRRDKGAWWCDDDDDECLRPAAAIVENGQWWFVAACDNEQHIAEALAEHERRKTSHAHASPAHLRFDNIKSSPRIDGVTWDTEVA